MEKLGQISNSNSISKYKTLQTGEYIRLYLGNIQEAEF